MDYVPVITTFKQMLNDFARTIISNNWEEFQELIFNMMSEVIKGKSLDELAKSYISLTVSEFNKILNKILDNINTGGMDPFFEIILKNISKQKQSERSDIYQTPKPHNYSLLDDEVSSNIQNSEVFKYVVNEAKNTPEHKIKQLLSEIYQKEGNNDEKTDPNYINLVSTDSRKDENNTSQVMENWIVIDDSVELESINNCEDSVIIVESQNNKKEDEMSHIVKKYQSVWSILYKKEMKIDDNLNKRSKKKTEKKRERDIERAIKYFEKSIKINTRTDFSEMITRENLIFQKKMIKMIKDFIIRYQF